MRVLTVFTIFLIFTSSSISLAFSDSHEIDFPHESNFIKDSKYIREHVNFTIPTREYSTVYDLANGDPDKAIEMFNHPNYPQNVYGMPDEEGNYDPNFLVLKKETNEIKQQSEEIKNTISDLQQDISYLSEKKTQYNSYDNVFYVVAITGLVIALVASGIGVFGLAKRKGD